MTDPYDFLLKWIIIGTSNCGKSCLLSRFVENKFKAGSAHTVGIEFGSKVVKIGNKAVKLQIWDSAGQERFRAVTRSYWRGAAGCLLVYDVTSRSSFTQLKGWLDDARALASPDVVVVLVGNKMDLEEYREVSFGEATEWANEEGLVHVETSALTGEGVEEAFLTGARSILSAIETGKIDPDRMGTGIQYGDLALLSHKSLSTEKRRGCCS
ncbi:small GTP-binding protein domain [Spizellomyces punctatus DAOM BR117]|uniref:Small GTP-binding protein domain n=1 Tax=Spizellomyces punctatus (strain DAOM BR117) TaxID=645134 RepID=A0A0L0HI58_SPIPD|nr:small GTP-binding protein domain [Spizellomyces punctatus DAOM BR117]KND01106.1 small GTP-binding protein domain [Spizellomyces punctatus DAOM BR117]|eukprot:XP_016609145.1 small GTP-binding protein domain [Spizellomyces punctatus DAOM BR117]